MDIWTLGLISPQNQLNQKTISGWKWFFETVYTSQGIKYSMGFAHVCCFQCRFDDLLTKRPDDHFIVLPFMTKAEWLPAHAG